MADPHEQAFIPPIVTDDAPRLSPARSSVKKSRASETNVVWVVVALLGVTGMFYALKIARQPAASPTPASASARRVVQRAEPVAIPRRVSPRPANAETVATLPAAEPVATVGEADRRQAVDPMEGFETGAAFDNPTSPGRYGQRTSGLLERMPSSGSATPPGNRPNAPDPSFRRPPR